MGDIAKALSKIGAREVAGGGYFIKPKDQLQPAREQGSKGPEVGKGKAGAGGSSGEMVEASYGDRTYWDDRTYTTSDGVFTFIVKPIKKVTFTSGHSITFAEPPEE